MHIRPFIITCLLLLCTGSIFCQLIDHIPGQLIVQLGADVDARQWMEEQKEMDLVEPLGSATDIYLIHFDYGWYKEQDLANNFRRDPRVLSVQRNHVITPRRAPNDTRYPDLWQYRNLGQLNGVIGQDMNVEPAWDVTTGGITANGDTIVVAVLDDGTDLDHEDLVANLWRNHGEIPNNGIDDDANGYVDDYFGYDTSNNDGDPEAIRAHGTPVAGIIGAVGNNGIGVAGVNWKVKIMTIRNDFLSSEAEVLQAYGYVLDARRLYNTTDGAKGAYVTVTNASWGRDYGNVEDSPIWCDLYDRLGREGVLSFGAVANLGIDVDVRGDLPTNCTSEYLVGVTNLDTKGKLFGNAGFGALSVDLGAHGDRILTTAIGNGYNDFTGTSFATPHVAGVAALLYAAPCDAFGQLLIADPAAAALYVRRIILETVRPNPELAGKTVTGGQLDAGAAMTLLMSECGDCLPATSFTVSPLPGSANDLVVDFKVIEKIDAINLRYRALGASDWITLSNPDVPLTIGNLPACVGYEFELAASCGGDDLPLQRITTSTDGCCAIPEDFTVSAQRNQNFFASWTPSLAGNFYRVRYRKAGTESWRTRSSNTSSVIIAGDIEACALYEFEFRTDCDTARTDFGAFTTVLSTGCGACLEENYCTPTGYENVDDWIAAVNIGNRLINVSGKDAGGYGDFTGASSTSLVRGGVYPVRITPGTSVLEVTEGFKAYVDWNQNGIFSSSEIVAEGSIRRRAPFEFNLEVPLDAPTVSTRIRVIMNLINVSGSACTGNQSGEYEDYCLDIREPQGCPPPSNVVAIFNADSGNTLLDWRASSAVGNDYRLRYRLADSGNAWVNQDVSGIRYTVSNLNLCGRYELEIASICNGTIGEFGRFTFADNCTDTEEAHIDARAWMMYPNPASGQVMLQLDPSLGGLEARIFSVTGKLVLKRTVSAPRGMLPLLDVPPGMYVVQLTTEDGRRGVRKLVVR